MLLSKILVHPDISKPRNEEGWMDKVEADICRAAAEGPAERVPEGGDTARKGQRHLAGSSSQSRSLSSHGDEWGEVTAVALFF